MDRIEPPTILIACPDGFKQCQDRRPDLLRQPGAARDHARQVLGRFRTSRSTNRILGVGQTVTMGIVSALGRGGFGVVDYEDFIQTDASINPGNSGGPLVDTEGRLVGINTFILSGSGGSMGIGFAVPINMARYVILEINRQKVRNSHDAVELTRKIKDRALLRVWSKNGSRFVVLDTGKKEKS